MDEAVLGDVNQPESYIVYVCRLKHQHLQVLRFPTLPRCNLPSLSTSPSVPKAVLFLAEGVYDVNSKKEKPYPDSVGSTIPCRIFIVSKHLAPGFQEFGLSCGPGTKMRKGPLQSHFGPSKLDNNFCPGNISLFH